MGSPKGKNLLPKLFFFRVDSFERDTGMQLSKLEATKVVSFVKNDGNSTKYIDSP